jgi:hypothetical protein
VLTLPAIMKPSNNVLLLTATITPMAGSPALARTDPSLRLEDYKQTLLLYLGLLKKNVISHIVFAENSGAELTPIKRLVADHGLEASVEFVSFYGLDFDAAKGRGYGEFKLVDYAMSHAHFLADLSHTMVWKCTGRYFIRNLEKVMRRAPADCDLLCHCRDYPYRLCDLYLLAWNRHGYEVAIKGNYPLLAENSPPGQYTMPETHFRQIVDGLKKQISVAPRFKTIPEIDGVRGWNNKRYPDRWYSPRLLARRAVALLFPWIWI